MSNWQTGLLLTFDNQEDSSISFLNNITEKKLEKVQNSQRFHLIFSRKGNVYNPFFSIQRALYGIAVLAPKSSLTVERSATW